MYCNPTEIFAVADDKRLTLYGENYTMKIAMKGLVGHVSVQRAGGWCEPERDG